MDNTLTIDTITAIATAPGEAGLGIVRLSGPQAISIAQRVFKSFSAHTLAAAPTHTALYGSILNKSGKIDRAMTIVMKAPRSYTGEDSVEITTHGSPVILRMLINELINNGARLAVPGEFTKRAYLNGKIDLVQAEAVADLICAKNDAAVKTAHQQLDGIFSKEINTIKELIIHLLAHIEVRLDHPDEDIKRLTRNEVSHPCSLAVQKIQSLLKTFMRGRVIKEGVKVAIIGKPNVGKSSLLNALLKRERAIVTSEPGTTRDTINAELVFNDIQLIIVDTAGIRKHSFTRAEHLGIERSKKAAHDADFLLPVFDISSPFNADDKTIIDIARTLPCIAVFNKSDLKNISGKKLKTELKKSPSIPVSALTGAGIKQLRNKIYSIISRKLPHSDSSIMLTNIRHEEALKKAEQSLHKTVHAAQHKEPYECIAFELNETIHALDEITGSTTNEDILDKIFKNFCVGK